MELSYLGFSAARIWQRALRTGIHWRRQASALATPVAQTACQSAGADVLAHRLPQPLGAALERLALLFRHFRLQHLDDALAADNAGQRHRGAEARIVGAGGEDRALVAQDHFGD